MRLREYPESCLTRRCREVTDFGNHLFNLYFEMFEIMLKHSGVGLAAPQIGLNHRIFVINTSAAIVDKEVPLFYANPKIISSCGEVVEETEGCLSLPGRSFCIERPHDVTLVAQNATGNEFEVEASGWYARIIQHEMDHLNGVLISDQKKEDMK